MTDVLVAAIEERYPSAACVREYDGLRIDLESDGVAYRARAEQVPVGRVTVSTPAIDGFELALRWTDRAVGPVGASFDDSCLVETNDISLAGVWLDRQAQAALIASRYTAGSPTALRTTLPMMRDGAWRHELRDDQVIAERSSPEPSVERIADLLVASVALAARPVQWARWFAPLAKALGGHAVSRVELGGRPVLRVGRGATEITVRLLRRLGPGDPGRLRTVVGAHRVGSSGETLALISDDLPRTAWPPLDDLAPSALAIDARARALLDMAHPTTSVVRRHDIEITFDGALADTERLSAAIELAAYWAAERTQLGPYR